MSKLSASLPPTVGRDEEGALVALGAPVLVASLLLAIRPGAPSSFLLLVAMPFAPSSVLVPSFAEILPQGE